MLRRSFLIHSLRLSGAILFAGRSGSTLSATPGNIQGLPGQASTESAFGFLDEGAPPMDALIGKGAEARRFTDLFNLPLDGAAVGNGQFFVRTGPPPGLARERWGIRVLGLPGGPADLGLPEIEALARAQGFSVLECAGNDPGGRFGLLSGAEWEGAPLAAVIRSLGHRNGKVTRPPLIRITGTDGTTAGTEGRPEASWVFSERDLMAAKAFFATRLNGEALSPENGYPVRLIVPGWYGCACIKWVREMAWVGEDAPATPFMRVYAGRTHQAGTPELARGFRPATMQWGALPVRIERPQTARGSGYRVVGLVWGGDRAVMPLQIRIGEGSWNDVDLITRRSTKVGWSVWSYRWRPDRTGDFPIRMRVRGATQRSLRLDSDYYLRTCRIDRL